VKAAAPGFVSYVLPPVSGGYSYIAIKHRDSFVTVYGHMSEVSVSVGQFVEAGDIIGKSGGAVGTP
jgi:murein DD-endopeptidase MepM/ murein hydrolase activator NlpD